MMNCKVTWCAEVYVAMNQVNSRKDDNGKGGRLHNSLLIIHDSLFSAYRQLFVDAGA